MRVPRTPRNNSTIGLEVEAERTLGVVSGIRTDASASVGIDAFLGNNKANGYIDPDNRAGGLSVGIGSSRRGLGGEVGVDAQFNKNGSINSIGGNISGSVLGFGGGVSGSSAGDASIAGQAFGVRVEVARDSEGNVTLQTCFGAGIFEACTTFSRDNGDPQNTEGSIKAPTINFGAGHSRRPPRPNANRISPNDTNNRNSRKKPKPTPPQADKPRPKPRPKTDKPNKPKTDKKPQLDTKKKPSTSPKKPISPRKKPVGFRKKPGIDPSPINLKKPITPPKPPSPKRPPQPLKPPASKLPKPSLPPKPTPSPKPPRPSPPLPDPRPNGFEPEDPNKWPILSPQCDYGIVILYIPYTTQFVDCTGYSDGSGTSGSGGFVFKSTNKGRLSRANYSGTYLSSNYRRLLPLAVEEQEQGRVKLPISSVVVRYTDGGGITKNYQGSPHDGVEIGGGLSYLPEYFQRGIYFTGSGPEQQQAMADIINVASSYGPEYKVIFQVIPFCPNSNVNTKPLSPPPQSNPSSLANKPNTRLPNQPTKIKPMDCCKEIKEIHKYLGIAKMKKDKFKVAKAFMVAGGIGNQECEDYYQVTQSLFRMLANGLIINPITKPLGNDWQLANATAWASQMYEMMAESMSDGNSTQKYEIASIMQLAQLMSTLAETARKIEFIIDAIGYEPGLDAESVTIPFTIYEGHKGFGKSEPKKIDISQAKTDNDVEAVLAKMLQPSAIPITKWVFKPDSIPLTRILSGM